MSYYKETNTLFLSSHYEIKLDYSYFPKEIENIIFEHAFSYISSFNFLIDDLPKTLIHLIMGFCFNKKVDHLPQNLIYLSFTGMFNKKINKLPKNLTYLILNEYFDQNISNLPKNLKYLVLSENINQEIVINKLPKNLYFLGLGSKFINVNIPKNLKKLSLTKENKLINNIPEHIKKLYITLNYWLGRNNYNKETIIENLPPTLRKIFIEFPDIIKITKKPFDCKIIIEKYDKYLITIKNKKIIDFLKYKNMIIR